MTPAEIQAAYAGLDLLLTGAARVAQMIREANNQTPVLAAAQVARLDAIENERVATGLAPTDVMDSAPSIDDGTGTVVDPGAD